MKFSMTLHLAHIVEKVATNEYRVKTSTGRDLLMWFPKKFLMNYIEIAPGDKVFVMTNLAEDKRAKLVTKHDFMLYPELGRQREKLK